VRTTVRVAKGVIENLTIDGHTVHCGSHHVDILTEKELIMPVISRFAFQ
jgi:hypothetical protein